MRRRTPSPAIEPCTLEDWHSQKEARVLEDALAVRSLYTLMFSFEQVAPDWMAGMCPSIISSITRRRRGGVHIKLDLLGVDLQPVLQVQGKASNGFVLTKQAIANRPDSAYLRPYTDHLFNRDFPGVSRPLTLPKPIVEQAEEYALR